MSLLFGSIHEMFYLYYEQNNNRYDAQSRIILTDLAIKAYYKELEALLQFPS